MIYCLKFRGDTAMEEQELAIDQTGQREAIEHIHNQLINGLIVLAETYISVNLHSVRKLK